MDFKKIEEKWQRRWKEEKIFESDPDKRKKFFITVAYPYPSGTMHIGHVRTYTVPDIISRFKRMQGFNVLFPMAWHVTGTPIIGAVNRLKEKEKKQMDVLKNVFKVSDKDLRGMQTPMGFANYFIDEHYRAGMQKLGYTVDWRRQFTTNDPHYNRFIEWQHGILYDKGLEKKGLHPVKWCLNCKNPVTTHDILEGEDADIQEFSVLKFPLSTGKHKGKNLVAATLRPETIFGQTNMWVRPDVDYVIARVGKEDWIMSKESAEKLPHQKKNVEIKGKVKGEQLIGEYLKAPGVKDPVIILPSEFVDPAVGTGIVTCVPSDAPYDYVALRDIQNDSKALKKYKLPKKVKDIKVIPIIETPGFGDMAGVKIVEDMGIKNQNETEKLDDATKKVYKLGYHTGKMNSNCGKYSGMSVEKAKELVKKELLKSGKMDSILEFSEPVTCRCGHPVVVGKTETWFIDYGNKNWKAKAKKNVKSMKNLPEPSEAEFYKTIDWLDKWPCVRNFGLGTKLPQDQRFMIEPLSDSTIYMAYYLLAHRVKEYKPEQWTKSFFDYVMLEKGSLTKVSKETGIPEKELKEMKKEVQYWY
ncbi:MAG: leucine--tRNA ligase, partial [Deltaproteobacteria bacterium]|nr:leucine--tRNA ligase [Deltaproteobacteria bacterium]